VILGVLFLLVALVFLLGVVLVYN